jgi:hypothetical protein
MDIGHFHNTMPMSGDQEAALVVFFAIAIAVIVLFALLITILLVLSYCKIFKKAGYSWAWGLLWLVPFGNIILPLVLAFGDWPIIKDIRKLKSPPPPAGSSGSTVV